MVNVLWGKDGEIDIRSARQNLFVIQFQNVTMKDRMVESGPWHIQNKGNQV